MKLKVYAYEKCSTCRKALKFLDACDVSYTTVPIREQPPTKTELRQMLLFYGGDIRRLFNTAGADYRALNLKEKLPKMSAAKAIDLLSRNGNLVKRPFVLSADRGLVGFNEEEWKKLK
jgi:arsenate reductase